MRTNGFTLMELMITVAIVAILASIALPSYTAYVQRGKIAEATSALADMRVRLEQYFQDNKTYVGAPICVTPPAAQAFQYDCTVATATAFTARARGVAAQGMNGFTFTIDQANVQRTTQFAGTVVDQNCWMRKAGAC